MSRARRDKRYPWIVYTEVGPVAVAPPGMPVPADLPESESDDVFVWDGRERTTWGVIRRRGYRYSPSEQI